MEKLKQTVKQLLDKLNITVKLPANISSLMHTFKLSKRDKYLVAATGVAVAVFIIIQFIASPILGKRDNLRSQFNRKQKELQRVLQLKTEFEETRQMFDQSRSEIDKREKDFTLFSFLDTLANRSGLKDRIAHMKPSSKGQKDSPYKLSIVEVKLQDVTMKQLVSYLYKVETSRNMVTISRISITKADNNTGLINSVIQAETIEL